MDRHSVFITRAMNEFHFLGVLAHVYTGGEDACPSRMDRYLDGWWGRGGKVSTTGEVPYISTSRA
jgi:hypothetical protein